MEELVKILVEAVEKGRVHVVQVNDESKTDDEPDSMAKAKKEAAEIAELNKILYEAHIYAGFTSEEALALTVAAITHE